VTELTTKRTRTSLHWGVYDVDVEGDRIVTSHPRAGDPDPSPIGQSIPTAIHSESRITQPMVRSGWLEHAVVAPNHLSRSHGSRR
jgi:biotin/methionine sulfoxide reductase